MFTYLKPKNRKDNIVIQELENEILIYNLKNNRALCLNSTSSAIWQLCDGTRSILEIADLMTEKLKMPVSEDLVWLAISDLKKENLVEIETNQLFLEGRSRREVIRKIGFASMIVLPVISSLVAPAAASAQSGCGLEGDSCSTAGGSPNSNGTCCGDPTSPLRCSSGTCTNCLTAGTLVPGGCSPANTDNIRLCCSFACTIATGRCN
jgi:hypothetical protein